jgi:hypothetical protein
MTRHQAGFAPCPHCHRIAFAGLFDLDDVGAHVAHELAAERAGDERAHFDNAKVGEGTGHRAIRSDLLSFWNSIAGFPS